MIKDRVSTELSNLIGGRVEIGKLDIIPFNEVRISDIEVYDLLGRKCLQIKNIGSGIRLWKLILEQEIELTYGEIIGLQADIIQEEKDGPLNIDFIINAFSSKNDSEEKKTFQLALKNVVLRKSSASFRRPWLNGKSIGSLNLSDLKVENLAADISFPKISDRGIEVDLRRLSLNVPDILEVNKIGFKGSFTDEGFFVKNFIVQLPGSKILIPEINLPVSKEEELSEIINNKYHNLIIDNSYITPSDLSFLSPVLSQFTEPLDLQLYLSGNLSKLSIEKFDFGNPSVLTLSLDGNASNLSDQNTITGNLSNLDLFVSSTTFSKLEPFLNSLPYYAINAIENLGDLEAKGDLSIEMAKQTLQTRIEMFSRLFNLTFEGGLHQLGKKIFEGEGEINIEDLNIEDIFHNVPVRSLNLNLVAKGKIDNQKPFGMLSLDVDDFEFKGKKYEGLSLNISKELETVDGDILIHNAIADLEGNFRGDLEGEEKSAFLDMDIQRLDLSEIIDMKKYKDYIIEGKINIDGKGTRDKNLTGEILLSDFEFKSDNNPKKLKLNNFKLTAESVDSIQTIELNSDWVKANIEGTYDLKSLPTQLTKLAETIFPKFIISPIRHESLVSDFDFDIVIKRNNMVPEFFDLPVRLLVPVTISGSINGTSNLANITLDIPYLQQGRDKLIYDTRFMANLNGREGYMDALFTSTLPVKKGDLELNLTLFGKNNELSSDIRWQNTENPDFKGHLILDTELKRNHLTNQPEINVGLRPSVVQMGTADWNISPCEITYQNKNISIDNFKISHEDQFVEINGTASSDYTDILKISLADIDVDYVFDMLQINYVTFGGTATGEIAGHSLLSGNPVAETQSFHIEDLSYNGCVIGDAIVSSKWNNDEKEIEIAADISHNGKRRVNAWGGIWLGRDSLCFNIDADKVPVGLVQPFMAVFSSHVGGFASGDLKLFGTFHDIDMTGKIFADSVAVKLDYTNTIYHGSDTVFMQPGRIDIPHFKLYDKFGNSAVLNGELTHHYFHDPSFTFRLSDANNLLCYDTTSELNPDWYGTLFGTGSALLTGVPGLVDISAEMTVSDNSTFTFVLNDTEYARDYQFLTFTDKRGEEKKLNGTPTVNDLKAMLKKQMAEEEGGLSKFGIDIRATVTPQALFTLVMDPAAGDKITARGRGAMQVKYESDVDEMMMYGKYEIAEGNYNFSLQDIILRDFKIKEGSYISFNGNPLGADLDISATYRVNTNLSDLDKSFSTDRDLNRTNVPVDAVLSVNGNMQHPDITFDIELPTLTQDVERKVKSIISTDDMMNRQIIYLLALNRFYTPEYMGGSGNGGELAAVASSTISSQLSNILGQLTDKFSVSPSFRSDKGDFSDIEVDLALSSRLLNNRLLINGNFGYRDRSNSSTTFVGDFDVEYLLSKNGNLRLKAYNHFNDQNYYLREALTTQGLGVVYRKDFDHWFSFLKKKKKFSDNGTED